MEKETATYSIKLAWRIPWTKKPDGLLWGSKELHKTERPAFKCQLIRGFKSQGRFHSVCISNLEQIKKKKKIILLNVLPLDLAFLSTSNCSVCQLLTLYLGNGQQIMHRANNFFDSGSMYYRMCLYMDSCRMCYRMCLNIDMAFCIE